jgi:hypothetical protein
MAKRRRFVESVWECWSYDVCGNPSDGFEVNDRHCFERALKLRLTVDTWNAGRPFEFQSAGPSERQIRRAFGLGRIHIAVEDNGDGVVFVARKRDGYPIGEMVLNDRSAPLSWKTDLGKALTEAITLGTGLSYDTPADIVADFAEEHDRPDLARTIRAG